MRLDQGFGAKNKNTAVRDSRSCHARLSLSINTQM